MTEVASPERIKHALQVLSSLENMKSREFICDFKVQVEKQSFNTHRALLAACSGYFEALFSSNLKEAREGCTTLKDMEASPIEQCIRYMYTGSCALQMDSIESTLHACNFLQLQSMEDKCFCFLKDNLAPGNCLFIQRLARLYSRQDLLEKVEEVISKNFSLVIRSKDFLMITKQDILHYISNADYQISWEAILLWSQGQESKLLSVVETMDFKCFPFSYLLEIVTKNRFVTQSEKVRSIITPALFEKPKELEANLSVENCFTLKSLAFDERSKKIIQHFMAQYFEIVVNDPLFCDLSKNEVVSLFSWKKQRELFKWKGALKWVKHDIKNRKDIFPELFQLIKLASFSLNFLQQEVHSEELVKTSSKCVNLLMEAVFVVASQSSRAESSALPESTSGIIWKQQPPEGDMKVRRIHSPFPLHPGVNVTEITFCFIGGSIEGYRYRSQELKGYIPDTLAFWAISDRIERAFYNLSVFKLKCENRSCEIIWDIPIITDLSDSDSFFNGSYQDDLNDALTKKGF